MAGTAQRNAVELDSSDRNRARTESWEWPPYAPFESAGTPPFQTDDWAPRSTVRHPWLRLGRWTLLYRRAGA
jgi:hypothetical protein